MDWQQVATTAAALLTPLLPYLVKAGEGASTEIGKKIGVAAWEKIKALYETVREKFTGDAYAEETLKRATEKPESEDRRAALAGILAEKAEADPTFGQELARLTQVTIEDEGTSTFLTQVYGGRVNKIVNIGWVQEAKF
jgi:hypothetical protein